MPIVAKIGRGADRPGKNEVGSSASSAFAQSV